MNSKTAKMLRHRAQYFNATKTPSSYLWINRKSTRYFVFTKDGKPDRKQPLTVQICVLDPKCPRARYKALKKAA